MKYGYGEIPTKSSRPHSHPKHLSKEKVDIIVQTRLEKRFTEIDRINPPISIVPAIISIMIFVFLFISKF